MEVNFIRILVSHFRFHIYSLMPNGNNKYRVVKFRLKKEGTEQEKNSSEHRVYKSVDEETILCYIPEFDGKMVLGSNGL